MAKSSDEEPVSDSTVDEVAIQSRIIEDLLLTMAGAISNDMNIEICDALLAVKMDLPSASIQENITS